MSERSRLRLVVLQVLVLSLLVTLFSRLWYLQVLASEQYQRAATENRIREIVTPAVRGLILDDRGRPLASNKTALVVSVDRTTLMRQADGGEALLRRLARVLDVRYRTVFDAVQLCGTPSAKPPPTCWNGSPYQPIPVTDRASTQQALRIMERQERFPGVTAELQAVRHYPQPDGANLAHVLGYLGPVSDEELARQDRRSGTEQRLQRTDLVGRSGLERQYDKVLRGTPGVQQLAVDHRGGVSGVVGETDPVPGNYLVTSIDAEVQAVVEQALRDQIRQARTTGDPNKLGATYKADSGAAVVMDVRTGRVIALASWPSYDPNIWVGGISSRDYKRITSEKNNYPNQSRAFQGQFAPASTFKVVSLPAAVEAGYSLDASYDCPGAYEIGDSLKTNYESTGYGVISMQRALEVSCDTVFYKFAYETWLRQGGNTPSPEVRDPFTEMAKGFGLGRPTGLDLPAEASGRIADRAWKRAYWRATKNYYCEKAKTGYPEVARSDPERAAYLEQLSAENCADGYIYRAGDAANFAIGQGDTLVTPLQMARVYAAVGNGGTLWTPQIAKAVLSPDGSVVKRFAPKKAGRVPVDDYTLRWMQETLTRVSTQGTGAGPFLRAGFPLHKIPVASKTGTGEVYGKQDTSWFASYAPADDPQYAVVMMISQGGTGSGVSGPGVAAIYKALFGVDGDRVDLARAVLPGGHPPRGLPKIKGDGTVVQPAEPGDRA